MQQDTPFTQPGAPVEMEGHAGAMGSGAGATHAGSKPVPTSRRGGRLGSQRQRGWLMIEFIIGLILFGVVLVLVLEFQERQSNVEQGRLAGEELAGVQAAFAQYFNAHRGEILAATSAPDAANTMVQRHCAVRVIDLNATVNPGTSPGAAGPNGALTWSGGPAINNGLKTCAFDLSLLQARGFWPRHLSLVRQSPDTGGAWRYVAIVRQVRGPGPDVVLGNADDVLTGDAEMLILRMNEAPALAPIEQNAWRANQSLQARTLSAAREAGPTGGFIPIGSAGACRAVNTGGANTIQACGPGWTVDLAQWIDATQFGQLRGALPAN